MRWVPGYTRSVQPNQERLIGRERELELIESFVAGASTEGGAFLVTGDAGVGKTELLQAAASLAQGPRTPRRAGHGR
jgi:predicted ATP-dependent serine protease